MLQPWEAYDSVPDYPADEDEDDDVFDWDGDTDYQPQDNFGAKQEAETASHLPPEYQSVLAIGYDKEASCIRPWMPPRPRMRLRS
jgi:hypothetical protein